VRFFSLFENMSHFGTARVRFRVRVKLFRENMEKAIEEAANGSESDSDDDENDYEYD
jgi:hypothetical protein